MITFKGLEYALKENLLNEILQKDIQIFEDVLEIEVKQILFNLYAKEEK